MLLDDILATGPFPDMSAAPFAACSKQAIACHHYSALKDRASASHGFRWEGLGPLLS